MLSAADKRLNDLREFESTFDTVAEWLTAAEAQVSRHAASVPQSIDNVRDVLDVCRTCSKELMLKQQHVDSIAVMSQALHDAGVSSSRSIFQLHSQYSLITMKLKVKYSLIIH